MIKKVDFSKFSSIKIGGVFDVFLINELSSKFDDSFIVGGANNLLISPTPPKLAMLSKEFDYIKQEKELLTIGAATPSGKILSYCKKHDLGGFEFLGKLPGTLGGMIKMNAGVKEWEIFNQLVSLQTSKAIFHKNELDFGYRYTKIDGVIFEATFKMSESFDYALLEMFAKMRANQPQMASAGSCFKNPKNSFAGKLIEEVGLKGYSMGDLSFSQTHANFLVNRANGSYEEAIALIELAKKRVFDSFGIELEEEIIIVR